MKKAPPKASYTLVVVQFLVTWVFFIFLLTGTVLLMNIDWARPQIEQMLSQLVDRKVELGRMSWNLGLNGLAITANKVRISELNGQPFLSSGPSQMGVAFMPLMNGKLIIRHVKMQQPEVWAVRLDRDKWNFSDLFNRDFDIRFMEVDRGALHLRDQMTGALAFSPYDFQDIGMKLTYPKAHKRWPLFLSMKMPRQGYTTSIKLTAIGNGRLADWKENEYRINLSTDQLSPKDLGPLSAVLPGVGGLYRLKLLGSGVLKDGIHATAEAEIKDMVLPTPSMGLLEAPQAKSSVQLTLDEQKLAWKELVLAFGNVELHSAGELSGWQKSQTTYQAKVDGKVTDLSKLGTFLPGKSVTTGSAAGSTAGSGDVAPVSAGALVAMLDTKKLTGDAEFEVRMRGGDKSPQLSTDIRASGLSTAEMLQHGPLKYFPWLQTMLMQAASTMKGEVKIQHNERIDLPSADITAGGADIHITGFWDKSSDKAKLKFSGQRIDLKTLIKNLANSKEFAKSLASATGLKSPSSLMLGGYADVSGTYEGTDKNHSTEFLATLKNAALAVKSENLSASDINGRIRYDGNKVSFEDVAGKLGTGLFQLKGVVSLAGKPRSDMSFRGDNIDLDQLNTALQLLKVRMPLLSEHELYGQVKLLTLHLTGPRDKPILSLTLVPEDLYYKAPGVSRPLRGTAGTITYDRDELILKDVPLVSHNNQLITNLYITNLSTTSDLKRVKVRSSGIELSEVNFFLSSALMPKALRKDYLEFTKRFSLSNAHGKAYGNLLWQSKPHNEFDLEGVVGLYNTSFKVGSFGWPLDHLSGLFAASGNELLVQDVSGTVGGNSFTMDGHVTNYRSEEANWQTELKAQVTPEKALKLIPGLADQFGGKISTSGPLALRAIAAGDLKSLMTIFSLRADPGDHLRITTPFGPIAQPTNQSITLDGSLTMDTGDKSLVQVKNANLIVGNSLLQASGKYAWNALNPKEQPVLDCTMRAPNPIPLKLVMAVLYPSGKATGVDGTIRGELTTSGPINRLTSRGYVTGDKLTLPEFNVYELTGRVETPGWSFDGSDLSKAAAAGSQTNLHIDSAKIGSLESKDIDAKLVLESSGGDNPSPLVTVHDATAQVAGGSLKMNGWADLTNHKSHLEADLTKVQANKIVAELMGHPKEISGEADASIVLDSEGTDYNQLVKNLDGKANFSVESGKVARFGQLQEKLTQANFLQSGIFGFNLNNLLQSVMPVRTGEFKDMDGTVSVSKGVFSIDQLKFNGDDMRLRAAGTINPVLNTVALYVAGNVPRVSSSLLSGSLGEMSRGLSIQKFLTLLTMHKLENLPTLPILGEIADDRPRAFTFHVMAPLDNSHMIGQSVQKSFRWLPNHLNASAHPVPGMDIR